MIGEQYNMNVTNVSKGGATLADNVHWSENSDGYRPYITDMLDNLDGDYEYIIAEGGLNDFGAIRNLEKLQTVSAVILMKTQ